MAQTFPVLEARAAVHGLEVQHRAGVGARIVDRSGTIVAGDWTHADGYGLTRSQIEQALAVYERPVHIDGPAEGVAS